MRDSCSAFCRIVCRRHPLHTKANALAQRRKYRATPSELQVTIAQERGAFSQLRDLGCRPTTGIRALRPELCTTDGSYDLLPNRLDCVASRLAAMQRAEKNIDGILEDLNLKLHRMRQESIDEELFDVIAGYEALTPLPRPR